ncbi:MAG: hypothetical protein QGH54_12745 [SAR202 cluster bacterium]|nr:hypothetical protein [SAR202 cluster bacterium]
MRSEAIGSTDLEVSVAAYIDRTPPRRALGRVDPIAATEIRDIILDRSRDEATRRAANWVTPVLLLCVMMGMSPLVKELVADANVDAAQLRTRLDYLLNK